MPPRKIISRTVWLTLLISFLVGELLPPPVAAEETCAGPFIPVSPPLTELGSAEYVRLESGPTGFQGGLYPGGQNNRPEAHEAAGVALAGQIVPRNAAGQPDAAGQIVLISVGMSNAASEFDAFQSMLHQDRAVNPRLVLVNGAQGGRVADHWSDPHAPAWQELNNRLARANVAPEQVQAAWLKQTLFRGGDFPDQAEELMSHLEGIVRNLAHYYPNLQIVYLSSRTRSFTYWRGISPEPTAFETGFAVKWLIERQIMGDPALNFDSASGERNVPYLSWGPYLWIDGLNERADGRTWSGADMTGDCTHPSASGNQQAAELLYAFFTRDSTAVSWFLASGSPPTAAPTEPAEPTLVEITPAATATIASTSIETATETATAVPITTIPVAPPTAGADDEETATGLIAALIILGASAAVTTGWLLRRRGG
jgi:hypothetical protein